MLYLKNLRDLFRTALCVLSASEWFCCSYYCWLGSFDRHSLAFPGLFQDS